MTKELYEVREATYVGKCNFFFFSIRYIINDIIFIFYRK